jgi:hypothetical protein
MKQILFFIIIFILSFNNIYCEDLRAISKNSCQNLNLLKKISKINDNFFSQNNIRFLQVSYKNKSITKKRGIINYKKKNFIRIFYENPKLEIIYETNDYITYHNHKLKSIKKYKNENYLLKFLLESNFEDLFFKKYNNLECQSIVENKENKEIMIKINVNNLNDPSKNNIIEMIFMDNSIKEIKTIFSKYNYIILSFI